ncbi:hypothetical protein P689_122268 [Candidatus Riesia pediculischaeffi PTSU]|uniref:Uncharacterized protein n=1 Tax=Candidatus Riesia pediculischaeffi PTSU TaxID=1401651 RepID=A0A0C1S978_9ENTR|nr:hypothetical protein P689_122268 [Candidatus Riesia pediculischaeffi PTSU]
MFLFEETFTPFSNVLELQWILTKKWKKLKFLSYNNEII